MQGRGPKYLWAKKLEEIDKGEEIRALLKLDVGIWS